MTPMRTVRVDPKSKTACADAGATWGDFTHATHAFPLPFIPQDRHGDTLALAVVHWAGPLDKAEKALKRSWMSLRSSPTGRGRSRIQR